MRVLVTGSRTWTDREFLWSVLDALAKGAADQGYTEMTVVHGGAKGADRIASEWTALRADGSGPLTVWAEEWPAKWGTFGRRAGMIRNLAMVKAGADFCAAFIKGESRGTRHCADAAEAAGIPVERFEDRS